MPYTAERPQQPDIDELRARIPGWGVDRDPADRPAVPKMKYDPESTGAHWHFPERQQQDSARERSIEHKFLTPVFGTSAPLRGVSGRIRRFAYRRYSEGRAAHWLLLIAADRVDAAESHLRSFATLRPDNPFTETGLRSELTHGGVRARTASTRVDRNHTWIDPIIIGGPWLLPVLPALWAIKKRKRRG
ncbi:hypothetical protein ACGFK1_28480 [Mycobacterium sp. NPDC048908]|uniref:hypothetical protein n=1 Tax=Mycobacterium sp. NPDC048908 TaxID=3364292 RepID=UPI00371FD347